VIEMLTLSLGGAVARSLLKLWLRDEEIAQSVGLSLAELAERGTRNFLQKRSIMRSFDRVAEEVARKLAPFMEAEFREVDSGEVEAAVIAAATTIDAACLDDSVLFATDLEPLRLEAALRTGKPAAAAESHLSEAGTAIYDFIMREAANYIVEVVSTLPQFQSRATRALLERESTLIALVEEVLERLPDDTGLGGPGDPNRFEAQYRREVARKLDRLELFGVRTNELNQRYALSVAYIGLAASTSAQAPEEKPAKEGEEDRLDRVELSIEKVLSQGRRHLLRGEAGSGKTTLLQWLAVSSVRRTLGESLSEWEDTVPFFIRLRRFVGTELPQPSDFPAALNASLAELMPPRWAIDQMEQGRALLLIDGVDELREDERAKAAEWLQDLVETYPEARYVVTSRPPAVADDWLDDASFSASFLEPMDVASIDAFIEHWHDAAKANASDDESAELELMATRLQATMRLNSQIRNLATSPLLCAMLCALNRDWKGQLPRDRVELYRLGLEMLLERRDTQREVGVEDLQISRQQKEVLLQDIAFWLLINGFSDARTEDVEHLLAEKIEAMPHLKGSPGDVLKLLLLRSGLIREPVEGRIDFIHRTFQEYLTAKKIVEDRSVGLLHERAAEDQWQEVVVLAAGLGTAEISQDLIGSLLRRAEEEKQHRHRLQLLAVACLETTPVLPKEQQEEIGRVLEGLIPPRSMSEAKAIASAGEVAVPMLASALGGPVATAAPTVRALGLIGGPAAMATLEKIGGDRRVTMARELLKAWDFFPTEEYAQRVLRRSPLERGALTVSDPEQLASIPHLQHLSRLSCSVRLHRQGEEWDWGVLAQVPTLRRLELTGAKTLTDLGWRGGGGKELRQLACFGCSGLERIALDGLDSLEGLHMFSNKALWEVAGLSTLPALQRIDVTGCPNLSETIRFPPSLGKARLSRLPHSHLESLSRCNDLVELRVSSLRLLTDITALAALPRLQRLSLSSCERLDDFSPLRLLDTLSELRVRGSSLDDLDRLALPSELVHLTIAQAPIVSFESATSLHSLRQLELDGCGQLESLPSLQSLEDLEAVSLLGCSSLRALDFIAGHPSVARIDLEGCRSVRSLEPLYELPQLEWLDIRGCASQLDPGPLLSRGVRVLTGQAVDPRFPRWTKRRFRIARG
jgi:Leucine-rich repeat (LRR) protein